MNYKMIEDSCLLDIPNQMWNELNDEWKENKKNKNYIYL